MLCYCYTLLALLQTAAIWLYECMLAVPYLVYMSFNHILHLTLIEFSFLSGLIEYLPWYLRIIALIILWILLSQFNKIMDYIDYVENVFKYVILLCVLFIFDLISLVFHSFLSLIWLLHGNPFLLMWVLFFIVSRREVWFLVTLTLNLKWRYKFFILFIICFSKFFF